MITDYAGFLPSIRPRVNGVDPNIASDTIRMVCRRFCHDSGVYIVDLDAVDLVADQQQYNMSTDADFALPALTEIERIYQVKIDNILQNTVNYSLYQDYILRWNDDAIPASDSATSSELTGLKVSVVLVPARGEDDALPDWFLSRWQEGIVEGVLAELFASKGMPYYDPALAVFHDNKYETEVSAAKAYQLTSGRTVGLIMNTVKPWIIS